MEPKFLIEEIVYLKTDPELFPRMITGYKVSKTYISYEVAFSSMVSWHYDYELTTNKEELIKINKPGFGK